MIFVFINHQRLFYNEPVKKKKKIFKNKYFLKHKNMMRLQSSFKSLEQTTVVLKDNIRLLWITT